MTGERQADTRKKINSRQLDRILAVVAVITIGIAWFLGGARAEADLERYLHEAMPEAARFEQVSNGLFAAIADDNDHQVIGYVTIGRANGYAGPVSVAVATDVEGTVRGVAIVDSKETPAYQNRVLRSDFLGSLAGKSHRDTFVLGEDLDAVSGATYTSRAIAEAVRQGSRDIASGPLGLPVETAPPPNIQFGVLEITVIVLFGAGYIAHKREFKYTKYVRWGSMIVGLVVLGFIYNSQLNIAFLSKLLAGYWPTWQTNLYWYLLLGGIVFVIVVDSKNPYCEWFCPFGAAQECLGALGGAKVHTLRRNRMLTVWIQRGLAWLAIVLALLFRNPGLFSYEVFGALFGFVGSPIQFVLLLVILAGALFIRRPWCTFLCPLRPVIDLVRLVRSWVLEQWKKAKPRTAISES